MFTNLLSVGYNALLQLSWLVFRNSLNNRDCLYSHGLIIIWNLRRPYYQQYFIQTTKCYGNERQLQNNNKKNYKCNILPLYYIIIRA